MSISVRRQGLRVSGLIMRLTIWVLAAGVLLAVAPASATSNVAVGLCAAPGTHTALAQAASTTAAATAEPDLSGFWNRVGHLWLDPVLDDDGGKPVSRLKVDRAGADDIWAGDFSNPILQPWAREIVNQNAESEIRREHVYTADDTCWPSGVPQVVNLLDEIEFLQTKDRVVIVYQRDHQVRWVWLNRDHAANPTPSWYGESVGHYEGDTLVIDTIGLSDKTVVDVYRTPHTEKLHVVERWRMVDGGKAMEAVFTVDDPDAFFQPWTGMRRYRRGQQEPDEIVCAENNSNNLFDYHIPMAEKPDF